MTTLDDRAVLEISGPADGSPAGAVPTARPPELDAALPAVAGQCRRPRRDQAPRATGRHLAPRARPVPCGQFGVTRQRDPHRRTSSGRTGRALPATVLTGCTSRMRVLREETFGPVAPVCVVDSFEQGLAEAADDSDGLAGTVLTASIQHAWRELAVGTVNALFGGAAHPRRGSGAGYGYGPELLDEMTQTKVVHLAAPVHQ